MLCKFLSVFDFHYFLSLLSVMCIFTGNKCQIITRQVLSSAHFLTRSVKKIFQGKEEDATMRSLKSQIICKRKVQHHRTFWKCPTPLFMSIFFRYQTFFFLFFDFQLFRFFFIVCNFCDTSDKDGNQKIQINFMLWIILGVVARVTKWEKKLYILW